MSEAVANTTSRNRPPDLYSPIAIAVATLVGWPLAGGILLALNYKNLGRRGEAFLAFIGGVIFTILAAYLIYRLPPVATDFALQRRFIDASPKESPGPYTLAAVVTFLYVVVLYGSARSMQNRFFDQHESRGGRKAGFWVWLPIALASTITVAWGLKVTEAVYVARQPRFMPPPDTRFPARFKYGPQPGSTPGMGANQPGRTSQP